MNSITKKHSSNPNKKLKLNIPSRQPPPLSFIIKAKVGSHILYRTATLHLPHGSVETPAFMPVGTYGTLKGLTSLHMHSLLGFSLILGNTYHLSNTPGAEKVAENGGLHRFSGWGANLLTDSGGFQMVSLLKLAEITENGVEFLSPKNGSKMLLTPEESIKKQNLIGADIIMALDDVVKTDCLDSERMKVACERTVRWIDRCIAAHSRPGEQSLFGIVQGGLDLGLREFCVNEMVKRDLPGYAIGGLAGGEEKEQFWKIVHFCCQKLPHEKPKYLMGIGYPLDLVVCSALGCDMFDSVFPARVARFGTVFVGDNAGFVNLVKGEFKDDLSPIDPKCPCHTCETYSRAFLHSIAKSHFVACSLLTLHNFTFVHRLMAQVREAMSGNAFPAFVNAFLEKMFGKAKRVPVWAVDALKAVGIELAF